MQLIGIKLQEMIAYIESITIITYEQIICFPSDLTAFNLRIGFENFSLYKFYVTNFIKTSVSLLSNGRLYFRAVNQSLMKTTIVLCHRKTRLIARVVKN